MTRLLDDIKKVSEVANGSNRIAENERSLRITNGEEEKEKKETRKKTSGECLERTHKAWKKSPIPTSLQPCNI